MGDQIFVSMSFDSPMASPKMSAKFTAVSQLIKKLFNVEGKKCTK